MTQLRQVLQLTEMGIDYAGFIFYEKSPRYVINKIAACELKSFNKIKKVGVFVNKDAATILKTVNDFGLDFVQLHGDETPDFCHTISAEIPVIKAFRISGDEDINKITGPYNDVADYFLFDTKAKEYGGTGQKFNWSSLSKYIQKKPYFLSGGIAPGDERAIIKFAKEENQDYLHSLDLNSKFEIQPGIKDMEALKSFINNLHASS